MSFTPNCWFCKDLWIIYNARNEQYEGLHFALADIS